jgi:hypothetical protein
MEHKIVSFYQKYLNSEIVSLQEQVFKKLGIELIQHEFEGTHGTAIENYLENNSWDIITLFDVDCIPLDKDVIDKVLTVVNDETIYGNAQVSNSFPYAAPSFLSFTRKLYEESPYKKFDGMLYKNRDGVFVEADCAEIFVKENLRIGKKQILSYPTKVMQPKWKYDGDDEYNSFTYGNGTFFDNNTFHSFQIRLLEAQNVFINFTKEFLNEKN